ncbi:MAG: mannose-6-phosphate isomerase [Gammaproteobacteria bacterium]|nr:MAG: mannose-6-phosphate isomerase [Gammaproteobacteria bacterium]
MPVPVILCGGGGTRLWPLSRAERPKPFLRLAGGRSLLEDTLQRAAAVCGDRPPLLVCNRDHAALLRETLAPIPLPQAACLFEPVGRNTAPAIAMAALALAESDPETAMLVLPSDHRLADVAALAAAVEAAQPALAEGALVTFGIRPTEPATGYGYIKAAGPGVAAVAAFTEKPPREVAERYLAEGGYYWNSGMFLFRARAVLDALARHAPDILQGCRAALAASRREGADLWIDPERFAAVRSDSIDYAVMEKADHVVVVPLDAGWNDLGSFQALWEVAEHDEAGNARSGDVLALDSEGCYLRSEGRLLAAVGLRDLVVVETADAVLVVPRARAEAVKNVVDALEAAGRPEARRFPEES